MKDNRRLICGDVLAALRTLPTHSVHAIVTDPPAGIEFMGKGWDSDKGSPRAFRAWLADVFQECRRVIKPGGHALIWSLPRTTHWTGMAIEMAGWTIRDVVSHLFGQGMPKSLYMDRETGDQADQGWGTALSPAQELWWLARAPLDEKTIGGQFTATRTGAINIDATRIPTDPVDSGWDVPQPSREQNPSRPGTANGTPTEGRDPERRSVLHPDGRWPANVILSPDVVPMIEQQHRKASRFFYTPKATTKEKEAGLEGLDPVCTSTVTGRDPESAGAHNPRSGMRAGSRRNNHPTVKSLALMRYLVAMVTPPGGVVLDPFCGSGSTGCATAGIGGFIGIDADERSIEIAKHRIAYWTGDEPEVGRPDTW